MKKINSLKALENAGLPVLPYKILSKKHFKEEIEGFIREHSLEKFMVRTDSNDMFSPSINNTTLTEKTMNSIREYFTQYDVFIMHPGNVHKNMHSLNILKDNKHIVVEVVGPGFIATDLNRYNYLHEYLEFDYPDLKLIKQKEMVDDEKYKSNIEQKLKDFELEKAQEGGNYLLKYNEYPKLQASKIEYIKKCVPKLDLAAKELDEEKTNWVASFSYVEIGNDKHEPIFWDLYCIN